jgi:hypothetical protein
MNGHSFARLVSTVVVTAATAVAAGAGSTGSNAFKGFKKFTPFTSSAYLRGGIRLAVPRHMSGARDFTELIAWQRADELEKFAMEIIKRPVLARDPKYCAQTADAAAAAIGLRRYELSQQAKANAKRIELQNNERPPKRSREP